MDETDGSEQRGAWELWRARANRVTRERDEWRRRAEDAERMAALIVAAAGGRVTIEWRRLVDDIPTLTRFDGAVDHPITFTTPAEASR